MKTLKIYYLNNMLIDKSEILSEHRLIKRLKIKKSLYMIIEFYYEYINKTNIEKG